MILVNIIFNIYIYTIQVPCKFRCPPPPYASVPGIPKFVHGSLQFLLGGALYRAKFKWPICPHWPLYHSFIYYHSRNNFLTNNSKKFQNSNWLMALILYMNHCRKFNHLQPTSVIFKPGILYCPILMLSNHANAEFL